MPEEHVAGYLKSHDVNTIVGKLNQKGDLKEHPDVKKFLEWKDKLKVISHAWGHSLTVATYSTVPVHGLNMCACSAVDDHTYELIL